MTKKQEEEFRQLTARALRLALDSSRKKGARGMPPPPSEQAMCHTVVAFHSTSQALSELFKSCPGRMSAR
jgi:hypothetical protein